MNKDFIILTLFKDLTRVTESQWKLSFPISEKGLLTVLQNTFDQGNNILSLIIKWTLYYTKPNSKYIKISAKIFQIIAKAQW